MRMRRLKTRGRATSNGLVVRCTRCKVKMKSYALRNADQEKGKSGRDGGDMVEATRAAVLMR